MNMSQKLAEAHFLYGQKHANFMLRKIEIIPVLNGFNVRVGCQNVVFTTVADLGNAIIEYYSNPDAVEKRYCATAINKQLLSDGIPQPENQATRTVGAATNYATAARPCDSVDRP